MGFCLRRTGLVGEATELEIGPNYSIGANAMFHLNHKSLQPLSVL
jgi:hypothetical protein